MAITRHATARWEGDLKSGVGRLNTPQSGVFKDTRYGFNTRFGDEKGANPEELIAAAHAGCFAMALSAQLTEAGHPPTFIESRADVELSMDGGPHITQVKLTVRGQAPGVSADEFRRYAEDAKTNCPISKVLAAVPISLDVQD
ncbi:OsmC family protein [Cognatilysobacter lacus]|uniref:OsmC family protein n=1 Tax=Cognatilysobacter lacus TaxID=1643323 RepID=A0A5D8YSK4_9GAMM|nr:OsmC family protein [Lysobacter lacus]TZF85360.1 OsmC family protein [Lysobacter lacus]